LGLAIPKSEFPKDTTIFSGSLCEKLEFSASRGNSNAVPN